MTKQEVAEVDRTLNGVLPKGTKYLLVAIPPTDDFAFVDMQLITRLSLDQIQAVLACATQTLAKMNVDPPYTDN